MINQDICEEKRINAKNSVEEYVYDLRNRLSDELKQYLGEEEYENFLHKLNKTEEWIYEEDQNEAIYKGRLEELQEMASPVFNRKLNHEQRTAVIAEFNNIIIKFKNVLAAYLAGDQQHSHIPAKDMEQIQRIVDEKEAWLQQQIIDFGSLKIHLSPPNLNETLITEKEKMMELIHPILSQPKPQEEEESSISTEATPSDINC